MYARFLTLPTLCKRLSMEKVDKGPILEPISESVDTSCNASYSNVKIFRRYLAKKVCILANVKYVLNYFIIQISFFKHFSSVYRELLYYTFNLTENEEHFVLSIGWNKRRKKEQWREEKKTKLNKIQQRRKMSGLDVALSHDWNLTSDRLFLFILFSFYFFPFYLYFWI